VPFNKHFNFAFVEIKRVKQDILKRIIMKTHFTVNIAPSIIGDMRSRLAATRWPDEIANDDWHWAPIKPT